MIAPSTNVPDESYRLLHFRNGERPLELYDLLTFECPDPAACIERVTSVMVLVANQSPDAWPDDETWRGQLPDWLLQSFHAYTADELSSLLADRSCWATLSWSFGSWLDRVRDREWRWWSVAHSGDRLTVCFSIPGHPYSAETLKHLITAAGASLLPE